jgi:hypothetical protein
MDNRTEEQIAIQELGTMVKAFNESVAIIQGHMNRLEREFQGIRDIVNPGHIGEELDAPTKLQEVLGIEETPEPVEEVPEKVQDIVGTEEPRYCTTCQRWSECLKNNQFYECVVCQSQCFTQDELDSLSDFDPEGEYISDAIRELKS